MLKVEQGTVPVTGQTVIFSCKLFFCNLFFTFSELYIVANGTILNGLTNLNEINQKVRN